MEICTYCGSSRKIQYDQVIAQPKGGVTTMLVCKACNQSKGDKPQMEWLRRVKQTDDYRWSCILAHNFRMKSDIAVKVQNIRDEE